MPLQKNILMDNPTRIGEHTWLITGPDKSRFPSGNSLLIMDGGENLLIDTNPGGEELEKVLGSIVPRGIGGITGIILSHTHLDHGRGLAPVFEACNADIYAHPDTLKRCERRARVGMGAGIPKNGITHFEAFGTSIGYRDKNYPADKKKPVFHGEELKTGNVTIRAIETFAHAPHMLHYEINDGGKRILLSCDYDFTMVPWYGVPQRGDGIEMFKDETLKIISSDPDIIITSHRKGPIKRENYSEELNCLFDLIDKRTQRAVHMLDREGSLLRNLKSFLYPIDDMKGRYSEDYIYCAKIWDSWFLLSHLEYAWMLDMVKCVHADNDEFLESCINNGGYMPRDEEGKKGLDWAKRTLLEDPPWTLPLNSRFVPV